MENKEEIKNLRINPRNKYVVLDKDGSFLGRVRVKQTTYQLYGQKVKIILAEDYIEN